MCRVLGVSRNGYYHYLAHDNRRKEGRLLALVKRIFRSSNQTYGTRRIRQALRQEYGLMVSRRRIRRIMKEEGWYGPKYQTISVPKRLFSFLLFFIGSSWSLKHSSVPMQDAAAFCRKLFFIPTGDHNTPHTIFRKTLEAFNMRQSMSAKVNCYDNAECETFFATLKTELAFETEHLSKKEASKQSMTTSVFTTPNDSTVTMVIWVHWRRKWCGGATDWRSPLDFHIFVPRKVWHITPSGMWWRLTGKFRSFLALMPWDKFENGCAMSDLQKIWLYCKFLVFCFVKKQAPWQKLFWVELINFFAKISNRYIKLVSFYHNFAWRRGISTIPDGDTKNKGVPKWLKSH